VDVERIDCSGLYCPEPLIALQRAVARGAPGTRVEVRADDPGFADDVRMWARATGHALEALEQRGAVSVATVRIVTSGEEER
jgi:TusA-related sulfurtransferase